MQKGYFHRAYAESLNDFGDALMLPAAGAWVLSRRIPGTDMKDAMGCYPLLCCTDWSALAADVPTLKHEHISFSGVTDPFGNFTKEDLERTFDFAKLFKRHCVVDLSVPERERVSNHHQREVRRALKRVHIARCERPLEGLGDWNALYKQLIRRHNIRGIATFSPRAFEQQLAIPGFFVYRAYMGDAILGMVIWCVSGEEAYHHLGAYSEAGYKHGASYALMDWVLRDLRDMGVRWANLGAGAGVSNQKGDGLSLFKSGWSNLTRESFFCGKILNTRAYRSLADSTGTRTSRYFPAYREGEFG